MNRRNPPAKWVLPSVVNPPGRLCVQLEIPDERFHRAAFWGALLDLAAAYKWADDEDHTAKDVAKVWRSVIDRAVFTPCPDPDLEIGTSLEDFMSQQIRISPDDGCIIQMWCIDHWEDWYDPRECIAEGATQPGPSAPPASGECAQYFVTLQGRDQWLLPIPVTEGMTIEISNAAGGWTDGTVNWYCPNGGFYTLGLCGAGSAPVGTDPLPSVSHMKVIGQVGTSGGYFDALDTTYVVPVGTTDEQVTFQANDSTLTDNGGSISFRVTVCNTPLESWSSTFDFRVSSYGGIVSIPYGTFTPGVGLVGVYSSPTQQSTAVVDVSLPARTVESLSITYDSGGASGGSASVQFSVNAALYGTPGTPGTGSGLIYTVASRYPGATALELAIGSGSSAGPETVLTWTVSGLGTKPAGWP